jgi:[acyl-carrier-protein] S-malonyltransferase
MGGDVVFLFPGQGSQQVGMGKDLWERSASVKRMFEQASDLLHKDLRTLCFEGPAETLVRTDNVQPAITLVNLAAADALKEAGVTPSAAAGHSLGEYAALAAAGVFSFSETMQLVQHRGAVMQQAAERHPGGMLAVFGLDADGVAAVCAEAAPAGVVELANHNSPSQVILTGEHAALKAAAQLAKQKGAKLTVPLKVSGAWHSRFMQEARDGMRERLAQAHPEPPSIRVIANVTADAYPDDPEGVRQRLVDQIVSPVRWSDSMARLVDAGHRLFLEVGPGKVLTGLMRDINRDVRTLTVPDGEGVTKASAAISADSST